MYRSGPLCPPARSAPPGSGRPPEGLCASPHVAPPDRHWGRASSHGCNRQGRFPEAEHVPGVFFGPISTAPHLTVSAWRVGRSEPRHHLPFHVVCAVCSLGGVFSAKSPVRPPFSVDGHTKAGRHMNETDHVLLAGTLWHWALRGTTSELGSVACQPSQGPAGPTGSRDQERLSPDEGDAPGAVERRGGPAPRGPMPGRSLRAHLCFREEGC